MLKIQIISSAVHHGKSLQIAKYSAHLVSIIWYALTLLHHSISIQLYTHRADASDNCEERQHCPSGTDDECETEGHICFGGTTCDSKTGHGNKFKYANVPYDDISNTRFCGSGWQGAIDHCR